MGLGGGPLNTWAGFLWNNSVHSKEGCVGVFFWGCFQEFVYKVCVSERRVCFCSGCVSGSPFLNTTNAVQMCGMRRHLCLRLCGGGRASACVCVHACVCMCSCVSVSIAEGGVLSVPQPGASLCECSVFVPVWAAALHLVCESLLTCAYFCYEYESVCHCPCPSVPVDVPVCAPPWCGRPCVCLRVHSACKGPQFLWNRHIAP